MLIDNGFNIEDYIGKPFKVLNIIWIILPLIIFFLFLVLIVYIGKSNTNLCKILFLITLGSGVWLTSCIQMRFKNNPVTIIVTIGLTLIILLAAGYMLPNEIMDVIKKFIK